MKVKIKQLEHNPYRDMNNYPMDEAKVRNLTESIKQTGFWDNILARKRNGKFQIAYGHHRLAAIREIFKPNDEVDIPVKELDDVLMIKIMANENMEDWKPSPAIIDETIRVARKFLDEHPEEKEKVSLHGKKSITGVSIISLFLNWPESRVSHSLERLNMIEEGKLDPVVVKELDTERAARNLVSTVKDYDIPKEKQRNIVEKYKETGKGERLMRDIAIGETFSVKRPRLSAEDKIKKIEGEFAGVDAQAEDLRDGLKRLRQIIDDIGGTPEYWQGQNWKARIIITLGKTKNDIDEFLNNL